MPGRPEYYTAQVGVNEVVHRLRRLHR